jgi:SWI/SNF-related matrix-associated actin-dependent regulator of chromatin subfamily A3
MGLGKTITCVSLMAATLDSAHSFAATAIDRVPPPPDRGSESTLSPSHFAGSVWGMPETSDFPTSAKAKAKASKERDKMEAEYTRACRIKAKSRATLIVCPLSTVSNWEDQFKEHWKGEVTVVGGGSGVSCAIAVAPSQSQPQSQQSTPGPSASSSQMSLFSDVKSEQKPCATACRVRSGRPLRVYIYHGNARRPDPTFLADFDAVITTYATLASEFSKQNRSIANAEAEDEEEEGSSDGGGVEIDERGNPVLKLPKAKRQGLKRKKSTMLGNGGVEATSALQTIHWFRVVLDEAQ